MTYDQDVIKYDTFTMNQDRYNTSCRLRLEAVHTSILSADRCVPKYSPQGFLGTPIIILSTTDK